MDIEQQLRESLAARKPPAAFESAVMARVQMAARQGIAARRAFAWRVPAALAATVLAGAVGLHWHAGQQRAAHDREQLKLALAITSHKLNEVQQRLVRSEPVRIEENGT
jgi:hypothetical protein